MAVRKGLAIVAQAIERWSNGGVSTACSNGAGAVRRLVTNQFQAHSSQAIPDVRASNLHESVIYFSKTFCKPAEGLRGILLSDSAATALHSSLHAGFTSPCHVRAFVSGTYLKVSYNVFGGGSRRLYTGARWSGKEIEGTDKHMQRVVLRQQSNLINKAKISSVSRRNQSLATLTDKWKIKDTVFPQLKTNSPPKAMVKTGVVTENRIGERISVVLKPVNSVKASVSHYKEAVALQLEAFWKRNYLILVGAVGLMACMLLWRIMFGIASLFLKLSEGMAKFGFLALAAAIVTIAAIVLKNRFTINADAVYRIAMRKLNTSAAVLEVMGAPLTGTDVRAYVMSGGGLRIKNFQPRLSGKRCFLIFPISGSERKGLVSSEVKKKNGQYEFKLLAVDVPTAGADQRLYLIGDEAEYRVGGGLISELRDPIVKAMAAQQEFDEQDEREEEEEDEQRQLEAEQAHTKAELAKLEREAALESKEEIAKLQREAAADRGRVYGANHARERVQM